MAIITLFNGIFCNEEAVIHELVSDIGYDVVDDRRIAADAARLSGIAEQKIQRAFAAKTSIFNKFTQEKELSIAYLKLALARLLVEERFILKGFCSMLIPRNIHHVLRVCLIADTKYRYTIGSKRDDVTEKEVLKVIRRRDEDSAEWVKSLYHQSDPWDASLYDMVIPMHKKQPMVAAAAIMENAAKEILRPTVESRQAVDDFSTAAEIEIALATEGHHVAVEVRSGEAFLTINKPILMLSRLEEELKEAAQKVKGVKSVSTIVGKDFHQSQIYRKHDFRMPSKVLLVDDEREFVETLSERLQIRDMGAAVTYDGQSALELVQEEEPEVIIIDLKMPGIDGLEVLKKVKKTRPEIEVVVLTGHGSRADREVCMKFGAFAYLQKPVDIDELSDILKKAHEKIQKVKTA